MITQLVYWIRSQSKWVKMFCSFLSGFAVAVFIILLWYVFAVYVRNTPAYMVVQGLGYNFIWIIILWGYSSYKFQKYYDKPNLH